jgi:hypothetical protein
MHNTPLLIVITGKQGCGKTCAARLWEKVAKHIDIDTILTATGHKISNPYRLGPTEWELWWSLTTAGRTELLRSGLEYKYGELRTHTGNLIVEGAILCNSWFDDALMSALRLILPWDVPESAIRRYFLDVPNSVLLNNILARGRPDELGREEFRTEENLANHHKGFDRAVGETPERWTIVHTSEELSFRLQTDVASS